MSDSHEREIGMMALVNLLLNSDTHKSSQLKPKIEKTTIEAFERAMNSENLSFWSLPADRVLKELYSSRTLLGSGNSITSMIELVLKNITGI
jgi:hypothetical protein